MIRDSYGFIFYKLIEHAEQPCHPYDLARLVILAPFLLDKLDSVIFRYKGPPFPVTALGCFLAPNTRTPPSGPVEASESGCDTKLGLAGLHILQIQYHKPWRTLASVR